MVEIRHPSMPYKRRREDDGDPFEKISSSSDTACRVMTKYVVAIHVYVKVITVFPCFLDKSSSNIVLVHVVDDVF